MNDEPHGLCHISEILDYILNYEGEHDRGCPYQTIHDAIRGFESATGKQVTDELKDFLI